MKRIITILLITILIFSTTGCSDQSQPESNETDSSQIGNTNEYSNMQSYYEVFYKDGLLGALNYFDNNYDSFDEESRNEYADALIEELNRRGNMYKVFADIEREPISAPIIIEYVDCFYPNIFNSKDSTFNIYTLDDELKNIANELKEDDVFSLCKNYWATEGNIEDVSFIAIVKKGVYEIISNRLLDESNNNLENVFSYTDYIGNTDSVFKSDAKYPVVLVENTEKLDIFNDASKTTLYIPLKIIDEPINEVEEENSSSPSEENAENQNNTSEENTQEVPKNMVIKNYNGPGVETLGHKEYDFKYSEELKGVEITPKNQSLVVFGTIYDVEIGTVQLRTESGFEGVQEYDTLSNVVIELKDCPYRDEMSEKMVYVSFYDEDLNYHTIGFAGEADTLALDFIKSLDIKETELKSGSPTRVAFETTEHAILSSIDGADDKFSAAFLVDNYEEYMTDESNHLYFTLDTRLISYYEEEQPISIIPLWVSSNMYDVEVVYSNYGQEIETYSDRKNIKAGTWLECHGILNGDGEAYTIKFKLKDGTEKEIFITTDESGEAKTINGYVISIY